MARLLIVEDHPLFAEGLVRAARELRPDWQLELATTGREALSKVTDEEFAAAIVDVVLPDMTGFDLALETAHLAPDLPLLFISGRDEPALQVRARSAGARGFISKVESMSQIARKIDLVLVGSAAFEPGGCEIPALTARQTEILALLAAGHSNKEIRYRLGIAERTVRAHLTELFHHLGVHSRMQAVIRARELGLVS